MLLRSVKHLATDTSGAVYASDGSGRIAILKDGWLVDVAVLPSEARISALAGLPDGGVAVADSGLNRIWKSNVRGRLTPVAGREQPPALDARPRRTDGPAAEAGFRSPISIAANHSGELFVAEIDRDRAIIRTIANGSVTTSAIDGIPACSSLGLAYSGSSLFCALGHPGLAAVAILARDREEDSDCSPANWRVNGFVGSLLETGDTDGAKQEARFIAPSSICVTPAGIVIVDGSRLRRIVGRERVETLAGSFPGNADGPGTAARFSHPAAVASTPEGDVLVADPENDALRLITPAGEVTTVPWAGRQGRLSDREAASLSKAFGSALIDDRVQEAWEIAKIFLRNHGLNESAWPDRTVLPTSVASARLGKKLADVWAGSSDPARSGVGLFCSWLIACEERALGVNEIRDHRLKRLFSELARRAR